MDHPLDAATLPPGAIYITEFLSREEEVRAAVQKSATVAAA